MFAFLLPKDEFFFQQFDIMSTNTVEGVKILLQMLGSGVCESGSITVGELSQRLKTIEHQSDQVVHGVVDRLHKSFITPIEREDIFHLIGRLDDILDLTEGAGSRINLYQPKTVINEALELTKVLLESSKLVQDMVKLLHNMKNKEQILKLAVEISRLEDQADYIRRSALARLFREEKDVFELIKWKDIMEYIERATDRCEDVANITEGIVIENT